MNKKPMATRRERLTTDIFEPFRPYTNTERLLAYYRKRAMYESIQPAQVRVLGAA
jgi:hypothetical protein